MTEDFEHIGKKLPYQESEEYLDTLIARVSEGVVARRKSQKLRRKRIMMFTSVAAMLLLVIGIGINVMNQRSEKVVVTSVEGPVDEFLNALTDEEVAQLPYYEIEEIPEY